MGFSKSADQYDCLGALISAYRDTNPEEGHEVAKWVFEACRARHGHTRISQLSWEDAFDLLRSCNA